MLMDNHQKLKDRVKKQNIDQKNQLEIEKKEIEDKYRALLEDHENLKKRIKDEKQSQRYKELKFNEKIDELNQETDILLDEVNKWQT